MNLTCSPRKTIETREGSEKKNNKKGKKGWQKKEQVHSLILN